MMRSLNRSSSFLVLAASSFLSPFALQLGSPPDASLNHQQRFMQQWQEQFPETPVPITMRRRLWASGLDPQSFPAADADDDEDETPTVVWTNETEGSFSRFYDRAMNPETCGDRPIKGISKGNYGLFPRIRDFQDVLVSGLFDQKTVVHSATPAECGTKPDPFMLCVFKPFSKCQGELKGKGPQRELWVETEGDKFKSKVSSLWKRLTERGLQQIGRGKVPPRQQLGVIRALLAKVAFEPTDAVNSRVAELEGSFGEIPGPTLAIHIHRTDAAGISKSRFPAHFRKQPMSSLSAIRSLIRKAEQVSGKRYQSFYLITDDDRYLDPEILNHISSAFSQEVKSFYNPYKKKMSDKSLAAHTANDIQLLADITLAQKYADYVIGCGRSGVSQFLAQKLGAKFRMDPNLLSLFEDDEAMLKKMGLADHSTDSLSEVFGLHYT